MATARLRSAELDPPQPKHTPGPWRVEPMHGICADVMSVGKLIPATIAAVHNRGGSEQTKANANMLAASPELFDALKDLLPLAEEFLRGAPSHPDNAKLESARAAILKAEGA